MRKLSIVLLAMSLAACGTTGKRVEYVPVVDMKGIDHRVFHNDLSECQNLALKAVGGADAGAAGAIIGGLLGVALSAASGSSYGRSRVAATGALSGGVAGVTAGVVGRQNVVKKCLSGRGYNVLS